MRKRTTLPAGLKVGQTLPCDAFDGRGSLLLCKGHIIGSDAQLERLLRNARWADVPAEVPPRPGVAQASALSLVLGAREQLHGVLSAAPMPEFAGRVQHVAGMVREACRRNADVALASMLMCREGSYPARHAVDVAIAACVAGTALDLDGVDLTSTVAAALTMNIGMLDLQEELQLRHGSLSSEQRMVVRAHCEHGMLLLHQRGVSDPLWLDIVHDHHERPDGRGYPRGKARDAIALPTQVVALADVYCARVTCREYRPAMPPNVALRWLFLNEGMAVDERLAAMFIKTLGIYPPGTSVRLQNGSVAVVTRRGATGRRPKVASITTGDGLRVQTPMRCRSDAPGHVVSGVVDLDTLRLSVDMHSLWGADAAV